MNAVALSRVRQRMSRVDAMPADVRACVHEFGLTVVDAMLACGITQARHMRHLVATVRAGAVEIGNREMTRAQQHEQCRRMAGYLRKAGFVVVPSAPTSVMVQASIAALDDAGLAGTWVARDRKHLLRLTRALDAGDREFRA